MHHDKGSRFIGCQAKKKQQNAHHILNDKQSGSLKQTTNSLALIFLSLLKQKEMRGAEKNENLIVFSHD